MSHTYSLPHWKKKIDVPHALKELWVVREPKRWANNYDRMCRVENWMLYKMTQDQLVERAKDLIWYRDQYEQRNADTKVNGMFGEEYAEKLGLKECGCRVMEGP